MRRTTTYAALLALSCVSLLCGPPKDGVLISAEYWPGFSDWKHWRTTITSTGEVHQDVLGRDTSKQHARVSREDVQALLVAIRKADFFSLKERYEFDVTDNPTLLLSVTLDGRTRSVLVYAPHHLATDAEVQRFLSVWSEVLRRVPSPNPDQKPN